MRWRPPALAACLALLSLFGGEAWGENEGWTFFFNNYSGDRFYFDPENLVYGPDRSVKVRERIVSAQPASQIRETASIVEFDCAKNTYRRVKRTMIFRDGSVREGAPTMQWSPVEPGSAMEPLMEKVCAGVKLRGRDR